MANEIDLDQWGVETDSIEDADRHDNWPAVYGLSKIRDHADESVYIVATTGDMRALETTGLVGLTIELGWRPAPDDPVLSALSGRSVFVLATRGARARAHADSIIAVARPVAASARIVQIDEQTVRAWLTIHGATGLALFIDDAALLEANELLAGFTHYRDLRPSDNSDEYLVERILPMHGTGALYGPSGVGKTFAALDLALSVAAGRPFAGRYATRRGLVVYLALEAASGIRKRVEAWRSQTDVAEPDFYLLDHPLVLTDAQSVADLISRLNALARHEKQPVSLLVIDTLSKSLPGGDQNSSKDMSRAMRSLEDIQRATGGAVLAVAHPGKSVDLGIAGWHGIHAGLDFVLEAVKGKGDGQSEIYVRKQKDGESEWTIAAYKLAQVEIVTSDSRPLTSAIVDWVDPPLVGKRAKKPSAAESVILDEIDHLIIAGKTACVQNDRIPASAKTVSVRDLLAAWWSKRQPEPCARLTNGDSGNFYTFLTRMTHKGLIGRHDGFVWRISSLPPDAASTDRD